MQNLETLVLLIIVVNSINPHSSLSSRHSFWPVIMITYNLPLWILMKKKFMMLSLIVLSPRQPSNDINVYLAPLLKHLKSLCKVGVKAYDAYHRIIFTSRNILL